VLARLTEEFEKWVPASAGDTASPQEALLRLLWMDSIVPATVVKHWKETIAAADAAAAGAGAGAGGGGGAGAGGGAAVPVDRLEVTMLSVLVLWPRCTRGMVKHFTRAGVLNTC
jgi:hypothetical protein